MHTTVSVGRPAEAAAGKPNSHDTTQACKNPQPILLMTSRVEQSFFVIEKETALSLFFVCVPFFCFFFLRLVAALTPIPAAGRHRGNSNSCGQTLMDFERISLTTRTQCFQEIRIIPNITFLYDRVSFGCTAIAQQRKSAHQFAFALYQGIYVNRLHRPR